MFDAAAEASKSKAAMDAAFVSNMPNHEEAQMIGYNLVHQKLEDVARRLSAKMKEASQKKVSTFDFVGETNASKAAMDAVFVTHLPSNEDAMLIAHDIEQKRLLEIALHFWALGNVPGETLRKVLAMMTPATRAEFELSGQAIDKAI